MLNLTPGGYEVAESYHCLAGTKPWIIAWTLPCHNFMHRSLLRALSYSTCAAGARSGAKRAHGVSVSTSPGPPRAGFFTSKGNHDDHPNWRRPAGGRKNAAGRTVARIKADLDTICAEAQARGWDIWYISYPTLDPTIITKAAFDAIEDQIMAYMRDTNEILCFHFRV